MAYVFKGNLHGLNCEECREPLIDVVVRLYRLPPEFRDVDPAVAATTKFTFAAVPDDVVERKQEYLIAEARTDEQGNFAFALGEKDHYQGEAFEVDIYCGNGIRKPKKPTPPKRMQFTLTALQPEWKQTEAGIYFEWNYVLQPKYWCYILSQFGYWTICGVVLTTDNVAVANARVSAFDKDWITDDPLGSDITSATGRFRIEYTDDDFNRTFLSPWINVETPFPPFNTGPDVYFKVETVSSPVAVLLDEPRTMGETPGRANVDHCFCVTLRVKAGTVTDPTPEQTPHWTRVEVFNVQTVIGDIAHNFQPEGYAGEPNSSFVFGSPYGGSGAVQLFGNVPLRNTASPTHPLKYRFMYAEWGWTGGGDGTAGALPSVAPTPFPPTDPVGAEWKVLPIYGSLVGDVYYNNGINPFANFPVIISSGDQDAQGFIKLDGKNITVPMSGGGTSVVSVSTTNFLRSNLLALMNSNAITSLHASRFPAWGGDLTQAGRSTTAAEQEPIRRYQMVFEVRDSVTNVRLHLTTLPSIILDNSNVVALLNLEELMTSLCNPINNDLHILYTVDHPHLNNYSLSISNNSGTVHGAPPLPNGEFTAGSFFFRGNASGPHNGTFTGGVPFSVAADPGCAYKLSLSFDTRHYNVSGTHIERLYCK